MCPAPFGVPIGDDALGLQGARRPQLRSFKILAGLFEWKLFLSVLAEQGHRLGCRIETWGSPLCVLFAEWRFNVGMLFLAGIPRTTL